MNYSELFMKYCRLFASWKYNVRKLVTEMLRRIMRAQYKINKIESKSNKNKESSNDRAHENFQSFGI
jgi:hypothetical protein